MPCRNCDCRYYSVSLNYDEMKFKIGTRLYCDCGEGFLPINAIELEDYLGEIEFSFGPEKQEQINFY